MMKILTARITKARVGFDERDKVVARMTFENEYGCCDWAFVLENPVDVQRLKALMKYADAFELKDLNGKIIRQVDSERFMRGFGHPIEDKFVPIYTNEFTELSKVEFGAMLEK